MAGFLTDFGLGSKPIRTVSLTSGSGTFTPLVANSWCRVTLVGAGQGGGRPATSTFGAGGGASGAVGVFWVRVPTNAVYAVGAGGAGATASNTQGSIGGATMFGAADVPGGPVAGSNNVQLNGGQAGLGFALGQGFIGSSSGAGGPVGLAGGSAFGGGTGGAGASGVGGGGGGAGCLYGVPGNGGEANAAGPGAAGTDATGYGAGGGGGGGGTTAGGNGGNGAGGLILIEEFGA